jgi:hypothetical protein
LANSALQEFARDATQRARMTVPEALGGGRGRRPPRSLRPHCRAEWRSPYTHKALRRGAAVPTPLQRKEKHKCRRNPSGRTAATDHPVLGSRQHGGRLPRPDQFRGTCGDASLRLLERDAHTVGRQIESQPTSLGM